MSDRKQITLWIQDLKSGNHAAAAKIWSHYQERMLHVARYRIRGSSATFVSQEDVVQTAFFKFWLGATNGLFPQLVNRNDLRPLLKVITRRVALDCIRRESRQKRNQNQTVNASQMTIKDDDVYEVLSQFAGKTENPLAASIAKEKLSRLLEALDCDKSRKLVWLKIHGCTSQEIAEALDWSRSTVVRKLKEVRHRWTELLKNELEERAA